MIYDGEHAHYDNDGVTASLSLSVCLSVCLSLPLSLSPLPGAWRYRVSTGTGRPGVSVLWLGEIERLICNFYLSVAARKIVGADPSLRYTSLLLGR